MSKALVKSDFDISQIVTEKTRFLTEIMTHDPDIAANWSVEALLSVSAHVASTYAMRQDLLQDRAHAQAIIMCLLNYALEYLVATKQSQGDHRSRLVLGLAIARRIGIEQLIAVAEKRQQEIVARLRGLQSRAVVSVRSSNGRLHYYGVSDMETELFLWSRIDCDLFDPTNLPVATLAEEQVFSDLAERLEEEIAVAGWVSWQDVLGESEFGPGAFAANYFRRARRDLPNPAGGVLYPFLMGVLVKAFGYGLGSTKRAGHYIPLASDLYVFGDVDDVIGFLERVVEKRIPGLARWQRLSEGGADPLPAVFRSDEDLGDIDESEVAAKIAAVAVNRDRSLCQGLVFRSLSHAQIMRVARLGLRAFERVVESAKNFHRYDQGRAMPDPNEVLEFWCDRVFMNVSGNLRVRLGETWARRNEPWRHELGEAVSLKDLLHLAEGFNVWPEETKRRLAETVPINRMMGNNKDIADRARLMLEIWGFMTRDESNLVYVLQLMARVQWDNFRAWFMEFCSDQIYFSFKGVMLDAAAVMTWSNRSLLEILPLPLADEILPIALPKVAGTLSEISWRHLAHEASAQSYGCLWRLMPVEQLVNCFEAFDQYRFSRFVKSRLKLEEFGDFFRPLLEALRTNEARRAAFRAWLAPSSRGRGLELLHEQEVVLEFLWSEVFRGEPLGLHRS